MNTPRFLCSIAYEQAWRVVFPCFYFLCQYFSLKRKLSKKMFLAHLTQTTIQSHPNTAANLSAAEDSVPAWHPIGARLAQFCRPLDEKRDVLKSRDATHHTQSGPRWSLHIWDLIKAIFVSSCLLLQVVSLSNCHRTSSGFLPVAAEPCSSCYPLFVHIQPKNSRGGTN